MALEQLFHRLCVFKHIVSLNSQLTGEEERIKVGQNKLARLFKVSDPLRGGI